MVKTTDFELKAHCLGIMAVFSISLDGQNHASCPTILMKYVAKPFKKPK